MDKPEWDLYRLIKDGKRVIAKYDNLVIYKMHVPYTVIHEYNLIDLCNMNKGCSQVRTAATIHSKLVKIIMGLYVPIGNYDNTG